MGGLCPKEDQEEEKPATDTAAGGGGSGGGDDQKQETKPAEESKPADEPKEEPKPDESKPDPAPTEEKEEPAPAEEKEEPAPAPTDEKEEPEPAEEKEEPAGGGGDDSKPQIVIRKEIRSMSASEQDRFFNAVDEMLKNKSGPGTSEFFRIAAYHGQPAPIYCEHGRETFPGWHRIYMLEFENALRAADKKLGNDGNIGLAYWDWTRNQDDGLPDIVRQRFKGWPDDFWPDNVDANMTNELRRADNNSIVRQLRSWTVARDARDCLLATQHWMHASTRFRGNFPSLETSHNSIHVIVGGSGGQMGGVAWAAFDITFWLHHCNVDRIYESYLEIEPDSRDEFENFQDTQSTDMFDRNFEPFRKENGDGYRPQDTFNTIALGHKYDNLFKSPPQQLREPPTVILFSQVKVYEFESKCYQIHAFVISADKEAEFKEPETENDIDYDSANYAGGAGIFGRGMECSNCMSRPPQDIVIDITATLRNLAINRYKAVAKIYISETTDASPNLLKLSDTPLPEPIITGPLFVDKSSDNQCATENKENNDVHDVEALQRYLQKFGYYAPERQIDGDYGDYTKQAVMDFQSATGDLVIDGIVGPKTRNAMVDKKRCDNIDPFAKNEVSDETIKNIEYVAKEKEIKYFIATQPGYLKKNDVVACIAAACKEYDENTSLKFVRVDDEKECEIKFSFGMFNKEEDPLRFDGAGGVLGRAGKGYVEFDLAERWSVDDENLSDLFDPQTWYRGQATVSLYYTALHELGHALGLDHSANADDVMSPWYNPKQQKLSKNDIERMKNVVGDETDE